MQPPTLSANNVSPLAGKLAPASILVNIPKLVSAYYTEKPDAAIISQRVLFGTSGHRGSSFELTFNEWHILAITQAICLYRVQHNISGPLFLGFDTHALSAPAYTSVLEVLVGNKVSVMTAGPDEYTPSPVISHAILRYHRGLKAGLADGIVITPSHNPPHHGGIKYNPPSGGPADEKVTRWIESKANEFLANQLKGINRIPFSQALKSSCINRYDFLSHYVNDLDSIIDMQSIQTAKIKIGVDPLGGAGIAYWLAINERYNLNLQVVNESVDPTFRFMTVDWDGQIRMDPSSPYAMESLIGLKDRFDVAFACDTDHDRHGIVTHSVGLMPANHYIAVAVFYLFSNRPHWNQTAAVGKTVVSSQMIDRVTAKLGRRLYETPVGFKWFADELFDGTLGFAGEESAGATFLRHNGEVWTTDKDGIVAALLAAEITAKTQRDPGEIYQALENEFGIADYVRIDAPATLVERELLKKLSPAQVHCTKLAGEPIQSILTEAPGNGAPIGGLKVTTKNAWFAARPSGTEAVYKIYAESFKGPAHFQMVIAEAQKIVNAALTQSQSITGKIPDEL